MVNLAIKLTGVTRVFGKIKALDDLSLEIPPGIVFGFLGPNGAGKTTTINLLLGLLEPTYGMVEVLGFDTRKSGDQARERTGALLENTGLYDQLSAEDNLEFYARVWRLAPSERKKRIEELLKDTGLWERRKDRVGDWSKGMRQKLSLARAMLHRPPLLLLDEPTAGLDVVASRSVRETITRIVEKGKATVFLTTHNMTEAEKLCQEIAVISKGTLLTRGNLDKLKRKKGSSTIVIKGSGFNEGIVDSLTKRREVLEVDKNDRRLIIVVDEGSDTSPLVKLLVAHGVRVENVTRDEDDLEDVFLKLVEGEEK